MMWTLTKEFRFEASHVLPHHDGKCSRLHGHSWVGRVILLGDELHETGPKQGMLVDYGDVSTLLRPMVEDYLDHHHLNDTLKLENPTSELIAKWCYDYLQPLLTDLLLAVEIDETCTSRCRYWPRGKHWFLYTTEITLPRE